MGYSKLNNEHLHYYKVFHPKTFATTCKGVGNISAIVLKSSNNRLNMKTTERVQR